MGKPESINLYDEFERLRRLIPDRPDWHLHNWGRWSRGEKVAHGVPTRSSGIESLTGSGVASEDASQHRDEATWNYQAEICEAIIRDQKFPLELRMVLSHVYEASVFRFRAGIDEKLIDAALRFWIKAQSRGLS